MSCPLFFCCRTKKDEINGINSPSSSSNASTRKIAVDNDKGIINVDYPGSPQIERFDDQNAESKESIRTHHSTIKDSHASSDNPNNSDDVEEATVENQNALVSFFSSIGDRLNELNKEEPQKDEEESQNNQADEIPEEVKKGNDGVPNEETNLTRSASKDSNNPIISFFNAKENHAILETFEDDSIIIEEKMSEDKIDIRIETTFKISPTSAGSVSSLRADKQTKNEINNSTDQSAGRKDPKISPKSKKNKGAKPGIDFDQIISKLEIDVPEATNAERKRFLTARKGDYKGSLEQLQQYIAWRKECHLDEDEVHEVHDAEFEITPPIMSFGSFKSDDGFTSCASSVGAQDRSDWATAAAAAVAYYSEDGSPSTDDDVNLPQLAHMVTEIGSETYLKDKSGNRILLLLPAQVNIDEVNEETYALAIGFYLDKKLDRESMEKIVVAIDLRAGK